MDHSVRSVPVSFGIYQEPLHGINEAKVRSTCWYRCTKRSSVRGNVPCCFSGRANGSAFPSVRVTTRRRGEEVISSVRTRDAFARSVPNGCAFRYLGGAHAPDHDILKPHAWLDTCREFGIETVFLLTDGKSACDTFLLNTSPRSKTKVLIFPITYRRVILTCTTPLLLKRAIHMSHDGNRLPVCLFGFPRLAKKEVTL